MKIKRFETSPALLTQTVFEENESVHFLAGQNSDLVLDLLRFSIGNDPDPQRIDNCNKGSFLLFGLAQQDDTAYDFCYILNAEGKGEHRIAVNFIPDTLHCSSEDTKEYLAICQKNGRNERNVFEKAPFQRDALLSESDRMIAAFHDFMETVRRDSEAGDRRPLFLYRFFDRLDAAVDPAPFVKSLAACGRQVFVSAENNYPANRLSLDLCRIVSVDDNAV